MHFYVCLGIRIRPVLHKIRSIPFKAFCNLISLGKCWLPKRLKCTIDAESMWVIAYPRLDTNYLKMNSHSVEFVYIIHVNRCTLRSNLKTSIQHVYKRFIHIYATRGKRTCKLYNKTRLEYVAFTVPLSTEEIEVICLFFVGVLKSQKNIFS